MLTKNVITQFFVKSLRGSLNPPQSIKLPDTAKLYGCCLLNYIYITEILDSISKNHCLINRCFKSNQQYFIHLTVISNDKLWAVLKVSLTHIDVNLCVTILVMNGTYFHSVQILNFLLNKAIYKINVD